VTPLRDDALATLRGWRTQDPEQERLRQAYVDHLTAHRRGLSRDHQPDHVTAGALVLSADHTEVLLTLHAKARRWFHLGGHCEEGDTTLAAAALREATEESGIAGLRLDPDPLHLDTHEVGFCGLAEHVRHLDVRFLAVAPPDARHAVSEESLDVRWWPVDALPTDEPDMWTLVDRALERVAPGRTSAGGTWAGRSPAAGQRSPSAS
jgi:8-oxo-dGTP pyrophosphatase MutT (NUDIX family)